jgi:hypothetical protein
MTDLPDVLEGTFEGERFLVRRRRLAGECAAPPESRAWEWWFVEVAGEQRGERFRASRSDTELSVLEQAKLILRGGGRAPPADMGQVDLPSG